MNEPEHTHTPITKTRETRTPDANRDPISGTHGAHPVGTGIGAAGAGVAGAAVGAVVAGPVGAIAGGVIGAVAGGLGGKAVAEAIDPTVEDTYWRTEHKNRSYYDRFMGYEDYAPAYRYGWENHARDFAKDEADLASGWEKARGKSRLTWDRAKAASRDAWDRVRPEQAKRNGCGSCD